MRAVLFAACRLGSFLSGMQAVGGGSWWRRGPASWVVVGGCVSEGRGGERKGEGGEGQMQIQMQMLETLNSSALERTFDTPWTPWGTLHIFSFPRSQMSILLQKSPGLSI